MAEQAEHLTRKPDSTTTTPGQNANKDITIKKEPGTGGNKNLFSRFTKIMSGPVIGGATWSVKISDETIVIDDTDEQTTVPDHVPSHPNVPLSQSLECSPNKPSSLTAPHTSTAANTSREMNSLISQRTPSTAATAPALISSYHTIGTSNEGNVRAECQDSYETGDASTIGCNFSCLPEGFPDTLVHTVVTSNLATVPFSPLCIVPCMSTLGRDQPAAADTGTDTLTDMDVIEGKGKSLPIEERLLQSDAAADELGQNRDGPIINNVERHLSEQSNVCENKGTHCSGNSISTEETDDSGTSVSSGIPYLRQRQYCGTARGYHSLNSDINELSKDSTGASITITPYGIRLDKVKSAGDQTIYNCHLCPYKVCSIEEFLTHCRGLEHENSRNQAIIVSMKICSSQRTARYLAKKVSFTPMKRRVGRPSKEDRHRGKRKKRHEEDKLYIPNKRVGRPRRKYIVNQKGRRQTKESDPNTRPRGRPPGRPPKTVRSLVCQEAYVQHTHTSALLASPQMPTLDKITDNPGVMFLPGQSHDSRDDLEMRSSAIPEDEPVRKSNDLTTGVEITTINPIMELYVHDPIASGLQPTANDVATSDTAITASDCQISKGVEIITGDLLKTTTGDSLTKGLEITTSDYLFSEASSSQTTGVQISTSVNDISLIESAGCGLTPLDCSSDAQLWTELQERNCLFECICGFTFKSSANYFLHRACHGIEDQLQCSFCGYEAKNWMSFHAHFFLH